MNKFIILLIVAIISLVSCVTEQDKINMRHDEIEYNRKYLEENISYIHDKDTGLCYAAVNLAYRNALLTNVPCNDAVMAKCDFIGSVTKER